MKMDRAQRTTGGGRRAVGGAWLVAVSLAGVAAPVADVDVVKALIDAVNRGDETALAALAAPDFVDHGGAPLTGVPALLAAWSELRVAVPDLELAASRVLADGKLIAVHYELQGTHTGPYRDVAPSGRALRVPGVDLLRISRGRIEERWSYLDRLSMLQQMTDPHPAPARSAPLPVRPIARFAAPVFLESVLPLKDGDVLVTSLLEGIVWRIGADGARTAAFRVPLADGPGYHGAMCLTGDGAGGFYLTVIDTRRETHGVWHVDARGDGRQFAALPPDSAPNGIARTAAGALLVADSLGARIWRIDATGRAEVWSDDALLRPRPYIGRFPGPNGIRIAGDSAWVTVSDRNHLVRIPIRADGGAGAAEIVVTGIGGDDFAIDDDGTMYVTTHPFDSVVRVGANGERAIIAGPAQGVTGPTAAALGYDAAGRRVLYVVTDGGLYRLPQAAPLPPAAQTPGVYAILLD